MRCTCGNRAKCKEGRGNNYYHYRVYECKNCGNKFATVESKMNYDECKKMIRKIHYARYVNRPSKQKARERRKRRRRNSE